MAGTGVGRGKHQIKLDRVWNQTVKGPVCHAEKYGLGRVGKKQPVGIFEHTTKSALVFRMVSLTAMVKRDYSPENGREKVKLFPWFR